VLEFISGLFKVKARKAQSSGGTQRLPDIPWKYNPPAPEGFVRPKPVIVPRAK